MKYFGEYLVSKGIISEEVLLDALFQQARAQPSASEIAFRKRLIPFGQILDVIKLQYEEGLDFKSASQKLGIWNSDFDQSILNETKYNHLPLAEVLVKSGAADLTVLTKALDEFLSRVELPKHAERGDEKTPRNTSSQSSETAISEPGVDPVLLEELLSSFSQDKVEKIKGILVEIGKAEGLSRTENLRALLQEIHTVRGLLRSVQMKRMESIVVKFEEVCMRNLNRIEAGAAVSLDRISTLGNELIKFINDFLKGMSVTPSEDRCFSDVEKSHLYDSLMKDISESA